jgi:hypothetical protein
MRLVNARRILWKSKQDSKKVGACFHPQCQQSFHKITYRRTKGEAEVKPQNKCGPDQPSEPHRSWISLVCFPTARRGGTTALVRQRSPGECHFYQYEVQNAIRRIAFRTLCGSQLPNLLKEQEVEKAAMPGQPARARAHFRFPLAIHPRELPAATSVTAIHRLASLENSNVFGEATLGHKVLRRN